MKTTFTTSIKATGKNTTGIQVPPENVAALGTSKKPAVKVSLHGYTYRSTVAVMGGVFMIPLSAENRGAANVKAGDKHTITLELDEEPRTVDVPKDLAAALAKKRGVREKFDASSYSVRKEFVRQVESAKAAETRERRIAAIIAKLG